MPVTIATLNVGAASKDRMGRIWAAWIDVVGPSVVVLTEISTGPGTTLLFELLTDHGYEVFPGELSSGHRGVLVASRLKSSRVELATSDDPNPGRCVAIQLPTDPAIEIVGMYVPNRGKDPNKRDAKMDYVSFWASALEATPHPGRVLIGDLNVVPSSQTPRFLPQEAWEYEWLESLETRLGMVDIMRNNDHYEPTWVAHTGEGYTYDHAFVSPGLRDVVTRAYYDHSTRGTLSLTDHSALHLTLNVAPPASAEPVRQIQTSLF